MMRFIFLLTMPLLAYSQPGPLQNTFFPWWDSPIVKDLNLTDEQSNRINTTVREFRDRLIDLRAAVEKSDNALSDCMNEEQPDARRCGETIEKSAAARAEMHRTVSQMGLRLRLVLTPQQWKELQRRRPIRRPDPNAPMRREQPDDRQPTPRANRPIEEDLD